VPDDPAHASLVFLVQFGALLLTALLLGRLAVGLRLPAITGELLAGVLLGPTVAGSLASGAGSWLPGTGGAAGFAVDAVAQLGLLMLVAVTGAQLDPSVVRRRPLASLSVGLVGLLLPLLLGIALGWRLPASLVGPAGDRAGFALFVGVALSVSAIPVLAKTLSDLNLLHREIGQLALAAAAIDAAAVWVLLSVVGTRPPGATVAASALRSVAVLTAFIVVTLVVGRPLVRLMLRWAARAADAGPAVATAVLLMLLTSAAAAALGLEPLFGAFLAGVLVGSASCRPDTPAGDRRRPLDPARLASLRTVTLSVFAPVFLATAGLRLDLGALASPTMLGVTAVVLLTAVAGKFAGAYLGARLARLGRWEGLTLGAGMNARGAVEIVVAVVGLRSGVLGAPAYTVLVLIAVFTSVMTPPLLRLTAPRVRPQPDDDHRAVHLARWAGADITVPTRTAEGATR
jgi:Kef-type K+ transport system membrane component KefB